MAKGMTQTIKDTLLSNTVRELEASLDPKLKQGYQAIVVAGMKVMFSDETHKILMRHIQEGEKNNTMGVSAVQGVTRLIGVIYRESKGRMNVAAAFPAAVTLLCYALEFAEQATEFEVSPEVLANATHILTVSLLKMFKIDQNQLAAGAEYNKRKSKAPEEESPEEAVQTEVLTQGPPPIPGAGTPPMAGQGV